MIPLQVKPSIKLGSKDALNRSPLLFNRGLVLHPCPSQARRVVVQASSNFKPNNSTGNSNGSPGHPQPNRNGNQTEYTAPADVWSSLASDSLDTNPQPARAGHKKLTAHNRTSNGASDWHAIATDAADIARFKGHSSHTPPARNPMNKRDVGINSFGEWLLYNYYNWRQDTVNDLQLILALTATLLLFAGLVKWLIVDQADLGRLFSNHWWSDLYQVMVLSFGENFPDAADEPEGIRQGFSIIVACFGLAAFALVLALVEQVVLESMENNVKQGSRVFESGHYLVLGWCKSQRDLEVVMKVLSQVCQAYRMDGGTTVVVMTQRAKLEMEQTFRKCIPHHQRYGTRFVFRQGSPLVPADLQLVAASKASATIVVSDASRKPDEADAQSVRCAILLDELENYRGLRHGGLMGHIIVELKTSNVLPLLRYSCSKRVMALPTGQLNAKRMSRMVKRPFISWVSQQLFSFDSKCCNYVEEFPQIIGCRFGELAYRFPDGTIYGLANIQTGELDLNPSIDRVVTEHDQLVVCRPTEVSTKQYQPLLKSFTVEELESFELQHAAEYLKGVPASATPMVAAAHVGNMQQPAGTTDRSNGTPQHATAASTGTSEVLHKQQAAQPRAHNKLLEPASRHLSSAVNAPDLSGRGSCAVNKGLESVGSWEEVALPAQDPQPARTARLAGPPTPTTAEADQWAEAAWDGSSSWRSSNTPAAAPHLLSFVSSWTATLGSSLDSLDFFADQHGANVARQSQLLPISPQAASTYMVPMEYMVYDEQPEKVLIAGWADGVFMLDLLRELNTGSSCLPAGSEVVLVNSHNSELTLGMVMKKMKLENIRLSHVMADPVQRAEMSHVDLSEFKCAIVLCDERWMDPDMDDTNGIDTLDQPSVLRLDATMMVVQLNIRKLLEDQALPPINIIVQKVAKEGTTRFEDRRRLPLGISVNFTSFSAKMLMLAAYNPVTMLVYCKLGECADLTIVDSSEYCGEGELISYWELIRRTQEQQDLVLGYYTIPDQIDKPIESVINPQGLELRSRKRVWNNGDGRLKFVIFRDKECGTWSLFDSSVEGSKSDNELQQRTLLYSGRST